MALFGPSAGGRREPRSVVEFRAGKMTLANRIVTPDKRKGLVYLKLDESQLLHYCWKDRNNGRVEDDFIIFPGDADFCKVPQCTTGRVFLLKFKNSSRKFFYWMQEPKEDKDEDICKKVNDLILNPRDSASLEGDLGGLQGLMGLDSRSLQGMLGNMDRQQLMELLNQGGPAFGLPQGGTGSSSSSSRPATVSGSGWSQSRPDTGTSSTTPQGQSATTPTTTASQVSSTRSGGSRRSAPHRETASASRQPQPSQQQQQRIHLSDLQNILSSIIPNQGVTAADGGGGREGTVERSQVNIADAITPEILRTLGNDPEATPLLQPHLPQTPEEAVSILTSPQFRHALGMMGSALASGQLGPLMSQFGLGQTTAEAAATGNTIVFAEAIQNELQVAKEDDDTSIAQQPMDEGSTQDPPKPDKKDGQQQNMETD